MTNSVMEVVAHGTDDRRFFRRLPPAKNGTAIVQMGNHRLWIQRNRPAVESVRGAFMSVRSRLLEREFRRLTCEWQTATKYQSSVTAICSHPSYQRIIGMGQVALPFILRELQQSPHLWFWALKAITGANPVPQDHRGRIALMAADWIAWGRQRGLCES